MSNRKFILLTGAAVAAVLAAVGAIAESTAQTEKIVKISVKKFEYTPATVELKMGEPVILELTTLDRLHGFSSPDLNLHADVAPNKTVRVNFTPAKAGSFDFLCDIFCGTGHGDVKGTIVVKE